MKKESEKTINANGSYTTKTIITTTPDDGFVSEKEIRPASTDTKGEFHLGYSKTVSYTTNDPRITRPFVYTVTGIFFIIGLCLFFFGGGVGKLMSLFFIPISVFGFFKAKKDIDKIAREPEKQNSQK